MRRGHPAECAGARAVVATTSADVAFFAARMSSSRRQFLRRVGGFGAAVGGGAVLGFGAYIQPRSRAIRYADERRPERLSLPTGAAPPRVLVIGGGLAGLVAAISLADRGFSVEVLEKSAQLGGKLATFRERVLGDQWEIEHGFHAFFDHYANLAAVLEEAGARAAMPAGGAYEVHFPDRPIERYAPGDAPLLYRLGEVVARSPSLRLSQFMHGLDPLLAYERTKTFAAHDATSFAAFGAGIDPTLYRVLLEPFARQTMNDPAKLSLAEAIRFFQFYFFGNPAGLGHRLAPVSLGSSVVDPLESLLIRRGGRVRRGVAVASLALQGRRIVGVRTVGGRVAPSAPPDEAIVEGSLTEIDGVFFGRRGGAVYALDGRCTHAGCRVQWVPRERELHCPCHGGRFDVEGRVLGGPPPAPLRRLPLATSKAEGAGAFAHDEAGFLAADACVLAVDPPAAKGILAATEGLAAASPSLIASLATMEPADGYAVARLWIDGRVDAARPGFVTTAGFPPIDLVAFYDRLQEAPRAWTRATGKTVVEVHAYALSPTLEAAEDDALVEVMWKAACAAIPEMRAAKVLARTLQRKRDFARFAPGDDAHRPTTITEVEGLTMAGDWISLPAPAALMEAASMSGRFAANAVLDRYGLRRIDVPTVDDHGPLWRVR